MEISKEILKKIGIADDQKAIIMKPIKREDRKKLPKEVKIVFFLLLKQGWVDEDIATDCFKKYPEYFETIDKKVINIKTDGEEIQG